MKGRGETISIRALSASFVVLALAVFKPFGLDAWEWQAYVHLAAMWGMGVIVCMVTDGILKYVVRMPRSFERGVSYIIRRNLWFQLINTPLVALAICLYRHFVMSDRVAGNQLSWGNYLETLLIIGFCSFAIGLYWRFKFRSRFLTAELEETRMLNEELKAWHLSDSLREGEKSEEKRSKEEEEKDRYLTLKGTTSESLTLEISNLLYIEAVGNYVKVCYLRDGEVRTDMLRATSKQMEEDLRAYPMMVRCHRAFIVNLGQVQQIVSRAGALQLLMKHNHDSLPVSRSNMAGIKAAING